MAETESNSTNAASDTTARPRKGRRRTGNRPRRRSIAGNASPDPSDAVAPAGDSQPNTFEQPASSDNPVELPAGPPAELEPAVVESKRPLPDLPDSTGVLQSPLIEAIEKIQNVTTTLTNALRELEEAYDLLDEAERQKIADENEIASLKNALSRLHQPLNTSDSPVRRRPIREGGDSRSKQELPGSQQTRDANQGRAKPHRRRRRRGGSGRQPDQSGPAQSGDSGSVSPAANDSSATASD